MKIRKLLVIGLVLGLLLTACEAFPFDLPIIVDRPSTPTPPAQDVLEGTPTPDPLPVDEPTPSPITDLTIWVPPDMDPSLETDSSTLFANRLQSFSDLHGGIDINVRVKAASGAGGLLDSLTATNAAAPAALPDLIVLSRPDLETAALKGLIFPLDGLTEIPDDPDWYGFSQDMALLQGSTFGLPFAADSLVIVYRPGNIPEFPETWDELVESGIVLAFPSESDQALFPLALYQAEGGRIIDSQRRPLLEVEPLTEVFRLFEAGLETGTFPDWLNQYQTQGQVWTAFRDGQVDQVVTWSSNFLKEIPADAMMMPLHPGSEATVTIGTGLIWTIPTLEEHRHPIAIQLAEYLVQPEYLSAWTSESGYIPPRPSSLEGWQNQSLRSIVSQVALMTRLRPSNDILTSLGPALRDGTRQILQEQVDPAQAAQVANENLEDS